MTVSVSIRHRLPVHVTTTQARMSDLAAEPLGMLGPVTGVRQANGSRDCPLLPT